MSARLIMVDVHRHVLTLMDLINAPARMVISWIVIFTVVLVMYYIVVINE